jgi:hypothetical protein
MGLRRECTRILGLEGFRVPSSTIALRGAPMRSRFQRSTFGGAIGCARTLGQNAPMRTTIAQSISCLFHEGALAGILRRVFGARAIAAERLLAYEPP